MAPSPEQKSISLQAWQESTPESAAKSPDLHVMLPMVAIKDVFARSIGFHSSQIPNI